MSIGERIAEEQGTTLVELMVGLAAGMVVLSALTMVIVVTLHGSSRVTARVEATQNGRVALTDLMEELHSSCVAPRLAPILAGSSGTKLLFLHATGTEGSVVAPNPTKTEILLEKGVLTEYDYAYSSGTSMADWTWASTAASRRLMTNVAPISPSSSVFTYYTYTNGALKELTPGATLNTEQAGSVIEVKAAMTTAPASTAVADAGASSSIEDSAVLRLTPPSFNEQAVALPCQ